MTLLKKSMLAVAAATYMVSVGASAAISQEQADRLGGSELTPMGAERAGNAAGTIPEWNPIKSAPAGYVAGGPLLDPFASDQVKFSITAANYEQYADNLSPGQIALLKRYPSTFKMDVYESSYGSRFALLNQKVPIDDSGCVCSVTKVTSGVKISSRCDDSIAVQQLGHE
mgnify:CR=1 FL=1